MVSSTLTPINVHSSISGLTIKKIHTNLILINGAIGSASSQLVIPAAQKLFELPTGCTFVNECRVPTNVLATANSYIFSLYASPGTSYIANSSAAAITLANAGYFSFVAVVSN